MGDEGQTIEAEVVEIDGVLVPPVTDSAKAAPWAGWGNFQGRVKRLDARWWPLLVVLGVCALVLLVVVGLFVAVFLVAFRILAGIARLFAPSRPAQRP